MTPLPHRSALRLLTALDGSGVCGQVNRKPRTRAGRLVHRDEAARLPHDAVGSGETQSGPFARFLGGKEGIEDFWQQLRRNTRSRVRHAQCRVVCDRQRRLLHLANLARRDAIGLYAKGSAGRHHIAGIDGEVHHDLFKLRRVDPDRPLLARVLNLQHNLLAQQAL